MGDQLWPVHQTMSITSYMLDKNYHFAKKRIGSYQKFIEETEPDTDANRHAIDRMFEEIENIIITW